MKRSERSFLLLPNSKPRRLPKRFRSDDVRYTDELVEYFLKRFTKRADKVLDPFAGFGTTLLVAERLGRQGYGIEFDSDRAHYIKKRISHPDRLLCGDARRISEYSLPRFDFCMTSPPYSSHGDMHNAFTAYTTFGGGYASYLKQIGAIYRKVATLMKANSRVVVEVSNIKKDVVTTLAWDIAAKLSKIFVFEGEIVIGWEGGYGSGYDHSYCLVFNVR